jgi:protein tyrosine phosphatase (PTP) superfamily phosphohydrolase (DUF442 family)
LIRRRLRRWIVRPIALVSLAVAAFVGWRYATGNQGIVVPGRIYRSAQLDSDGLAETIRRHGIRTVLNLRGSNPDQPWYRAERAATLGAGATQVDVPLASDFWLSRVQARTIVDLLDSCEKPILVHCEWGAERTGLVCSIAELLKPGGSVVSALGQFSTWYLFLPVRDGRRMRGHALAYRDWLSARGLSHSPERFRGWIKREYRPRHPSREEWPYDPYPQFVVTRPPAMVDRVAGRPAPMR